MQPHGSGRAVATELITGSAGLAVVVAAQQEHAHRARKQRQRGVNEDPHEVLLRP